jgi:probable F420-dependent oxidoreductase
MKFGAFMFPTDYSMNVVDLGRAVEERGFDSFFVPEHTHIPSSRETPWPGGPNLPREYSHTLDPFVALGAVAAATSRIKLGTAVCLVAEHDAINLAKQVATVDHISGGRMLFGIGGGWNLEEMRNHGTDPAHRWKVVRERINAVKQIWTNDEASFHGQYVDFDPIWQWPKPIQKPHPPILVGGDAEYTLKRVVDYGDEWMPILGRGGRPIAERIAELQRLAAEKGRDPIPVTLFAARPDPASIEEYSEAGVTRCLFVLPPAEEDRAIPLLDRWANMIMSYA